MRAAAIQGFPRDKGSAQIAGADREPSSWVTSGGLDEVAILGVNPFTAFMTVKGRSIEYVAHLGSAPGAFAFGFAEADHWAENRGKYAADNHRNTEKSAKAGEAKHCADDDAHGRYDYPEEQASESTSHGRFFCFGWRLLLGLRRDFGTAKGTEAPRR
jgi:hypothetical protein